MAELTSDAYLSIRNYVNSSTGWDYIELYDDAGNAVTRVSITGDTRCQWLDEDGDKTLQIEFDVSGSDANIPIPTTLKYSAVWDSASGGDRSQSKSSSQKRSSTKVVTTCSSLTVSTFHSNAVV